MKPYRILPILLLFLLGACNNSTPDRTIETVEIGGQTIIIDNTFKRKALVVGIADYVYADVLKNPTNDANDIADILRKLNFEVSEYTNLDQDELRKAIDKFGNNLEENDIALFFYAGHGIQANSINYLVPTDAQPKSEADVEYSCVNAKRVLAKMETAKTKLNILILDACRNNPFKCNWRGANSQGLASMSAPTGTNTIIAFATGPDNVASDGDGRNGLYTSVLKQYIQKPDLTFVEILDYTGEIVRNSSSQKQDPWMNKSSFRFPFYIAGKIQENETTTTVETIVKKEENEPIAENNGDIVWQDDKHGTFTDQRDGQSYKVVKIGEQVWMAENLAYKPNSGNYWAYDNDQSNIVKYGYLYDWETAKNISPDGWRLPSKKDFEILLNNDNDERNKAYYTLNDKNSNFNIIFAGFRNYNADFLSLDKKSGLWIIDESNNIEYAWNCYFDKQKEEIYLYETHKNVGLSVRLLRD